MSTIAVHNLIQRGALVAEQAAKVADGARNVADELAWWKHIVPSLAADATGEQSPGSRYAAMRIEEIADKLCEYGLLLDTCPGGDLPMRRSIESRVHELGPKLAAWGALLVRDVQPTRDAPLPVTVFDPRKYRKRRKR